MDSKHFFLSQQRDNILYRHKKSERRRRSISTNTHACRRLLHSSHRPGERSSTPRLVILLTIIKRKDVKIIVNKKRCYWLGDHTNCSLSRRRVGKYRRRRRRRRRRCCERFVDRKRNNDKARLLKKKTMKMKKTSLTRVDSRAIFPVLTTKTRKVVLLEKDPPLRNNNNRRTSWITVERR